MKYETRYNLDDIRETYYIEKDIPEIDREAIDELIKREKEAILCPYPIKEDNGTIKDCIKKGHCACSEKD